MSDGVDPRIRFLERIDRGAIAGGQAFIRGTGVRVSDIVEWMAAGIGPDEILAHFPQLSRDDITAALLYAARAAGAPDRISGAAGVWIIFAVVALVAALFLGIGVSGGRENAEEGGQGVSDLFNDAGRLIPGP